MSVANNLTGKTLSNRYEILRPLGEGGMGKVYLAKDKRFGKQVVVKVPTMEAGDKDFKDRFMREIASIATLEHPHIVTTVDWGEIDGIPFLVLRYLGGGNLRDRITDAQGYYKPMPLEDLNQWLPQIASALDFIHSKNWVHRDLKPDNILFDEAGNPYLADFGIAKALEGAPMGVKTTMGAFIGTPQYMAPEMHLGKEVGPRSDQFGLAVLVYEALAGKIPFAGATPTAIFMEVMLDKARLIHELVPGIPLEKSNALMKGITKEPKDRYGSCVEFANAVTGSMLAQRSSSAGSETPSRVAIPDTRMETPKKPDIPGTRIESSSKPEITGTRMEKAKSKLEIAETRLERNLIKEKEVSIGDNININFVLVPAGTFIMGSPVTESGSRKNETQHSVTITRSFYLGKYVVTQEQWEAIMGTGFLWFGGNPSFYKGPKLPVTNVSWLDCQDFIRKLNASSEGGFRLPTEAEWEYACRAGTTTAYSFGGNITKSDVNYDGPSTKDVGSYKPNAFGLYDMHGNVWEWCNDWYGDYLEESVTDPKGAAAGTNRVLRGGSFYANEWLARSFNRGGNKPTYRSYSAGLRLARNP